MAPKKVEEPERKPLIGRVGTNLKVGIVGIPNVGKSTFFNVLTKSQAAAENFPFCTIDPNENKGFVEFFIAKVMCDAYRDYVKENDKKYAKKIFDLNASYIGKIDYLHHIKEHPRSEYVLPWPPPHDAPYTKAHMYYVYNEDTNPFTRVGATCKCVEYEYKPHFEPPKEPFVVRDPYSETEARTKKLDSEPTTFVIFGKPGLNISKLATAIANASKCVLISPEALLKQEIDNKTDAGRYIARILRTGRAVGPEVIWKLIEIRISKRDVMHKGYVVEGLPLIPNDLNLDYSSYLDYEKDNEENDEISQRWSSSACDLLLTPESSDYRIAEKSMCKTENSYEEDTLRQIDDVFLTWPVKPSVIVYTICPDQDAISKRSLLRFDPRTGETIDTGLLRIGESMRASPNDADLPFGFYQEIMKEEGIFEEDQRRHLLTRIFDMRKNVEVQCLFYERSVMPVIEKWVLRHNPQNVVRVDARTSTSQMWEIVSERLRTLPLSLPSHAQRLIDPVEIEFQGEATTVVVANEKYEELSPEEVFLEMTNVGSVSPRFPWRLSRWKYLCPVELIKGRSVVGLAKHAVRFTDKIYFLSSSEAVELFLENPRTFLLPPNPRPTCKIAIFGPKYCGKSYLSRELARDFSGTVIDVHEAEEAFKQDRIEAMVANAMRDNTKDVISELKNRLVDEREARETSRLADLEAWLNDMFVTIGRLADLRSKVNDKTTVIAKSDEDESKILLEKLRDNGLASVETDKNLLKKIRANKYILRTYAPNYLREEEPRVPTPNEHDPLVLAMLDDRVRYLYDEPIDLGIDEKLRILVERIKTIPDESLKGGIQRDGGFVLDGMYVDADLWTKLAEETDIDFEDLILITEEEPFERLVERWLDFVGKDEESESDEYNNVNDRLSHDERENEEDESGLEAYIRHLANFRNNWNDFVFDVANVENDLIVCDVGVVDDVVGHAKKRMKERYDFEATIMSEEDREKEKLAIEEGLVLENLRQGRNVFDQRDVVQEEEEEEEEEEEGEKEEEGKENVANQIRDARWLGDTNDYCPVALSRHNVLWKGKEEFSATFMGKVYLFSSAVALEEFVQEPRKFGVPFLKPPATIPPLRISVIGPLGSGRTALSSALSKEYGLTHIDYTERFAEYMKERAMPPLTPKHTLIFPEDRLEEVVLPEDLTDEKYNSDQATVYTFVQHYSKNGGVLPTKMLQEWLLDFFRSPYDEHGLILNGFPSCSQDVDVALKSYTVPEVVIELRCSVNTCVERLLPVMLDLWKKRQDVRKSAEEERYNQELELYVLTRDKWINRIFEKRRAQEQAALLEEEEGFGDYGNLELEKKASSSRTMPTYDFMEETDAFEHVDVDDLMIGLDREELEEIWRREHPEPTEFTDWEDIDVARERMEREIEEAYDDDARKLEVIRESMEEETISWLEIDAESEEISVLLRVQSLLDPYVFRDISIFERVHPVSIDTAEQLLDRGYHYLSSFGRWCPVRISENKIPVQMFLPNEADRTLRAVLHRQYVYFLSGEKALKSFSRNPLKYLEQDSCLPLIPLRIAVIGPPKCGKTTLAERFAATYGMRLITRGTALRHALKNFEWTELAKLTKARLRSGHATLNESVARAVEMYSVHPHSATQGYVLDGFPTNRAEYEDLAFLGIQPMIVVDLKADLEFCLECLSYDVHNADEDDDDNDKKGKSKERRIPFNFSAEYLTHRYVKWRSDQGDFRKWLKKYAQNIVDIDATGSKWGVWTLSDREVRVRYADIRKYFREADYEKAHGLENMCVSPFEFKSRQSIYENYCPVCLLRDNAMISAELPLDRRGLVQLKDKFYWICQRHAKHFNDEPAIYVPPANTAVLPKERPRALQEVADPLHACWIRRIQFDGFCLVTYVENLPNRNLRLGRRDIGAIVEDKVYLFCSVECRQKFLSRYHDYSHVRIHFPYAMPPINVKELPNIGFLEQTVAKVLVEAVNQVAFLRPKIPGLSVSATAAVYIGVYLKIHDRSFDSKETSIYETVGKRMEARRQIIDTALRTMKRRLNPRVYFSKEYRRSIYDLEEKTSQQMSNYIRFRRTSPRQTLIDPNFPELFE